MKLVECVSGRFALGVERIEPRLNVQRLYQGIRVEEELQDRLKQFSDPSNQATMRLVERFFFERVVWQRRQVALGLYLPKSFEQVGPHAAGVEKSLELDGRQLTKLFFGVVDPRFSRILVRIWSMICSTSTDSERMVNSGMAIQPSAISSAATSLEKSAESEPNRLPALTRWRADK